MPCKPDPSSALHICNRWQLEPEQVVIVGDDKTDMICGIRAGTACTYSFVYRIAIFREGKIFVTFVTCSPEEVRQEVKARGGAIIKIKFAREISDGMLWNV